jgi:hypothetical protein
VEKFKFYHFSLFCHLYVFFAFSKFLLAVGGAGDEEALPAQRRWRKSEIIERRREEMGAPGQGIGKNGKKVTFQMSKIFLIQFLQNSKFPNLHFSDFPFSNQ